MASGTMPEITPELLLNAYGAGLFPMADDAQSDELHWYDPPQRGILPLDRIHVPRRLRRTIRQRVFDVRVDTAFETVMRACASPAPGRERTWINERIIALYTELHRRGSAHSVECWQGETLAGGLYGVSRGGAFFGESMFSRAADASKVALVHLVARLRAGGFVLLDTQFVTDHLTQFGAVEIPRALYRVRLAAALRVKATFAAGDSTALVDAFLQSTTHTS